MEEIKIDILKEDNGVNFFIKNIKMPKSKKNRYKIGYNKNSRSSYIYKDKEWTEYEQGLKFDLDFLIRNYQKDLDKNKIILPLSCKSIEIDFYFKTKRRKDLINLAQFIDILVEIGILKDDDWQNTGTIILKPFFNKNIENEFLDIKMCIK